MTDKNEQKRVINRTMPFDEDVYEGMKADAQNNARTLPKQINWVLREYLFEYTNEPCEKE